LMHGQGTITYEKGEFEGDKYIGEWKNGKQNGQGIYTWGGGTAKGDKYVGEFINNQAKSSTNILAAPSLCIPSSNISLFIKI